MEVWLVIIGFWGALFLLSWLLGIAEKVHSSFRRVRDKARLYDERIEELSSLDTYKREIDRRAAHLEQERAEIQTIVEEKTAGFPWLAYAFADYFQLQNLRESDALRYKKYPARTAAERVKEIAKARREVEGQYRIAKYLLRYYEGLFPWLVDFRGEDLDDLIAERLSKPVADAEDDQEEEDPAQRWLTASEYRELPATKRYQLALDRYWTKRKSPWEIGRDYERYVGYLYEAEGYAVQYQGIVEGFSDLGRDIIARKDSQTQVVQCKNWSSDKVIHEKHIFQLFGTLTAYRLDHPDEIVSGRFVTSTGLSDRAKEFASILDIAFEERLPLARYPCIKCNVSTRTGERIYHLPFDQQYDRTNVEREKLERYVETVVQAELLGFRRAKRWLGIERA